MGNPDYPSGKAKSLKKMPDGNPFPYEREDVAENGVCDDLVVEKVRPEEKYTPNVSSNEGDDGSGGSGK